MIGPSVLPAVTSAGAPPACVVVVCRGPNCRERGGLRLRKRLGALLRNEPTARLVGYACFGQCDFGPNVVFYPEGAWYGHLSTPDAAEQVVRHATRGEAMHATPLQMSDDQRQEHLKNVGELVDMLERDRQRPRRWWWPF